MIIYQSSKQAFNDDVKCNVIANKIWESMHEKGISTNQGEINSWQNSLNFMKNILDTASISSDSHIAIEYKLPFSQKRIDFMISGHDENHNKNIIIIELKQWTHTKISDMNDHVISFVGKSDRELLHPSYQARSYQYSMFTFLSVMQKGKIISHCCSYLHNASKNENLHLLDPSKYSYIKECPIYFKEDFEQLQKQIAYFIGKGDGKQILFEVEDSKLVPSKQLIKVVADTIRGNSEFMLIDSQKFVYENIMSKLDEKNNVFIINGNPGTGKSVVALNLLASMLKSKKLVSFIAPNAAYRNNLIHAVKSDKKTSKEELRAFEQVCKGSATLYETPKDLFDWLIVDEAHRLKDSTAFMYKGDNQIEDILNASKNVVFFVDDNQRIRDSDIGNTENIKKASEKLQKHVFTGDEYTLETQFRCAGAQGYINALDTVLQIQETGNFYLDDNKDYEVRICDTPQEMQSLIEQRIADGFKTSRIVAGFAWDWITQNLGLNDLVFHKDIIMEEYNYGIAWNYKDPKMLWASRDDGVLQAGCVHTCQGLEFDYCGVIIGNDLQIDDNNNIFASYKDYKDTAGKSNLKNRPEELSKFVKNIYKILLSRGQKGTYIFIRDVKLREYFKKHIANSGK